MTKRIELDGKFFRYRCGKLVEIPTEWLGVVPTKQTIRNRPSKLTHKRRLAEKSHNRRSFGTRSDTVRNIFENF